MKAQERMSCCENCRQRTSCREIFVLSEILKDEASYVQDSDIQRDVQNVVDFLRDSQFRYPHATTSCELSFDENKVEAIKMRMQAILGRIRNVQHIGL